MKEETTASSSEIFLEFDTCQNSIVHAVFPEPYGTKDGGTRYWIVLYLAPMLATFGVLLLLAFTTLGPPKPNLNIYIDKDRLCGEQPEGEAECNQVGVTIGETKYETEMLLPLLADISYKPLHWDMNIVMMFLITFPLFVIFLVSEREVIPHAIASILDSEVLKMDAEIAQEITNRWEPRYAKVNLASTIIGVGLGFLGAYGNHAQILKKSPTIWASANGAVNPTGWYMLGCLVVFYTIVTITVLRSITTTFFLRDLVHHATVRIIPFHPDKSGGLAPVGKIGLRNQYLLSIIGINIILLLWALTITETFSGDSSELFVALVGLLIIGYIIFGLLAFLGPLLPFRQAMKEEKDRLMGMVAERTDTEFRRIASDFQAGVYTQEDSELIARLQHLGKMIDNLPVWPFDSATLRKFVAAYVAPLLVLFISVLLTALIQKFFIAIGIG